MSKPLIRWFFIPFVKFFLVLVYLLKLPVSLVNSFGLILALISSMIIFLYPSYTWITAIVLFFSFVMDITCNAWAKYKHGTSSRQRWSDETSGVVRTFLIFFIGGVISFNTSGDYTILILSNAAIFSYMMMVYGGALIEYINFRYDSEEDISNIIKKSLGAKGRWIIKSPVGFSFEYQWAATLILIAFNQFYILFWLFIIFGNLKWIQGYFMLRSKR